MAHSVNGFNGLQDARLIELKKLIGLIELKKDKSKRLEGLEARMF